ncbi:hypothetical protein L596_027424 [Steinernema carpocapsae]|uniref:Uncharacterized protein n=1 Tax=Steinernema carpocapsae TaxID=34508 RepID=A0A4U5M4B5_STECR|nr:hypothetical protein L596_027424 [Steinernema carpocapsae]
MDSSLLHLSTVTIIHQNSFFDYSSLPKSLHPVFLQNRSILEFRSRFAYFKEFDLIMDSAFRFSKNQKVDILATLENVGFYQSHELFQHYCATGALHKLQAKMKKCDVFDRRVLVDDDHPLIHYFATKVQNLPCRVGLTTKRLFACAVDYKWFEVAIHFYEKLEVELRRRFLIRQWRKAMFTEDAFQRYVECQFVEMMAEVRNFEIEEEHVRGFCSRRR